MPGDGVDKRLANKEVGEVNMVILTTKNCQPFWIYCFNKPKHVKKFMARRIMPDEIEGGKTKNYFKDRNKQII